jgi:hypothetical protein
MHYAKARVGGKLIWKSLKTVDIPTVSGWMGRKDGAPLAMKVYGHLRDQHSAQVAQRVTF